MFEALGDAIAGAVTRDSQTFTTTADNRDARRDAAVHEGPMFAAGWLGVDASQELRRAGALRDAKARRSAGLRW